MNGMPPTVGIDPGCGICDTSATGVVAVAEGQPVWWVAVRRAWSDVPDARFTESETRDKRQVWAESVYDYIDRVMDTVYAGLQRWPVDGGWTVAVESFVTPSGWMHGRRSRIDPVGIAGTAAVAAVVARELRPVIVAPSKHGKRHLSANGGTGNADDYYPACLIGRREAPLGDLDDRGANDDLWAAWDVIHAAHDVASRRSA